MSTHKYFELAEHPGSDQYPSEESKPTQTCKVAKADVQQLKSIRDDLANRFKQNDSLWQAEVNANTRKRLKRKLDKLTSQITAVNRLIKHLETLIK